MTLTLLLLAVLFVWGIYHDRVKGNGEPIIKVGYLFLIFFAGLFVQSVVAY